MTGRLLCVAPSPSIDRTATVARITRGAIHRPSGVVSVAGGKGLNVARAAARLGVPVTAVTFAGGHRGRWLVEQLAAAGVEVRAHRVPDETRECLSVRDETDDALTEFYEPSPPVTEADWRALCALVAGGLERAALMTVSGSLPPGLPETAAADLCALADEAGVRCAVDTHGPALAVAVARRPWLLKVNAGEAAELTGLTGDPSAAAARLVAMGARHALVTRGVDGAVLADPGGVTELAPPPRRGPYPVGSGDAYLAGLAAGTLRGLALPEAAGLAAAVAAANALVPGAGELRLTDIQL